MSKNLPRLRGACKAVRDLLPDAKILVACWSLESNNGAISSRLKEAGASAICTTFLAARQFIHAEIFAHDGLIAPLTH